MTKSTNDIMANTPTTSSSELAVEANRQDAKEMQTALETSSITGNKQARPIDDRDENSSDEETAQANTVTGNAVAKRRKLRPEVSQEEHVSEELLDAHDATVGNKEHAPPAKEEREEASEAPDKIAISKNDDVEASPSVSAEGFSPLVDSPALPYLTMVQTEDIAASTGSEPDFFKFTSRSATLGFQEEISGIYSMPDGSENSVNGASPYFSSPSLPVMPSAEFDDYTYELTSRDYGIMASEDYVLPLSDYPLEELYMPGSPFPLDLPTNFSDGYYSFNNQSLNSSSFMNSTLPSMGDQEASFSSLGMNGTSPPSSPPTFHTDHAEGFEVTTPMDFQEVALLPQHELTTPMDFQEVALLPQEELITPMESQELALLSREFPSHIPSDLVAIQEIKGKGHGIVAVRPIQAGTRILSEKALVNTLPFSVKIQTLALEDNELYVAQQIALLDYPNLAAYSTLTPGRNFDALYRNTDVILSNGFEVMIAPEISVVKLFRNTSLYNHSCTPNTYWHFDYDKKEIVTQVIKDVAAGEELTICYIEDGLFHAERQIRLQSYYNFTCVCPLCSGPPDMIAKKDQLIAEFKKLQGYSGYLSPYAPPNQTDILTERLKYYSVLTYMTVLEIEGQLPMHQIFVGARRFFGTDQQRKSVLGLLAWEAVQRYMGSDSDEARFLIAELPGLPVHYWQGLARMWSSLETEKKVQVWKWLFEDEPGMCPRVGPFDVLYRRGNVEW